MEWFSGQKMSDLRQYTKKFLLEFIEMYKAHPELWQIKNKDYRDKAKKAAAYELLVNKCREVEPHCDKDTVVKKINSLRTCYRKEFKKVQNSLKGLGEVYKPKLWYFDVLSFLNDDTIMGGDSFIFLDEDATSDFCGAQSDPLTSQSESLSESARSSPTSMFIPSDAPPPKKKRLRDEPSESFAEQRVEEDEFDLLGRLYSNKLRKLEKAQRIYAEKIINDTLFEAQLGNLSRQCRLVTRNFRQNNQEVTQTSSEIDLKPEYPESDPVDTSFLEI